jgi:urease accessory protein
MSDGSGLLAALQLSDSGLPIGRFVHSYGLEAWLHAHPDAPPEQIGELVEAAVCEAVAPLDGAVVAQAHRAISIGELVALDACLTARKLSPAARAASQSCGRRLAVLAPQLAVDDLLVIELTRSVEAREADGNLAVVAGTLARALAVPVLDAVLVELRGVAAALLSAAVRLGALTPTRAQALLSGLVPAVVRAANEALELTPGDLSSTAPELELFALAHPRADVRLFAS